MDTLKAHMFYIEVRRKQSPEHTIAWTGHGVYEREKMYALSKQNMIKFQNTTDCSEDK